MCKGRERGGEGRMMCKGRVGGWGYYARYGVCWEARLWQVEEARALEDDLLGFPLLLGLLQYVHIASNRSGGSGRVARYHDDANARVPAFLDRSGHLRRGRGGRRRGEGTRWAGADTNQHEKGAAGGRGERGRP